MAPDAHCSANRKGREALLALLDCIPPQVASCAPDPGVTLSGLPCAFASQHMCWNWNCLMYAPCPQQFLLVSLCRCVQSDPAFLPPL